ncbi:MAG TPA: NAD-dependent epimerase/dehydratase family protein [Actinomycetota bacterium]
MILVAGGTGFIGSAVVRRLLRDDADVAVMSAHPASVRRSDGVRLVEGDVLRPASLPGAVSGAEVVVQALTFPTFPVEKPSKGFTFEEFEHHGTERLVRAAEAAGVRRYVYVSGVGASPDAPKLWHRAKWAGEQAVLASSMSACVLRPSWVYGADDRALNRFLAFARRGPAVPVIGDGSQRVQPVFVEDVADVVARAAGPEGPTGVFEVGGPDVMTMNDVLRAALRAMGAPDKRLVHVPAVLPKAAGAVARILPKPPLSPDAVDFATGDALAETSGLLAAFPGLRLRSLDEGLATYLRPRR